MLDCVIRRAYIIDVEQQKTHARRILRLRQLRREREMTQTQLGALVGLETATISGIETGDRNPSFQKALAIAAVFDLPVEEVFRYVDVEVPVVEAPEVPAS